jgi:hypothetical protein
MGVAKAQALIRSEFTTMSRLRAERIARTEIVSASNLGSIEAARSTGLNLQKNWLSTRDARTREAHASVDGQVAELNGYFIVMGEELSYPGDIRGSAGNVISCRCSVTYTEVVGAPNVSRPSTFTEVAEPESLISAPQQQATINQWQEATTIKQAESQLRDIYRKNGFSDVDVKIPKGSDLVSVNAKAAQWVRLLDEYKTDTINDGSFTFRFGASIKSSQPRVIKRENGRILEVNVGNDSTFSSMDETTRATIKDYLNRRGADEINSGSFDILFKSNFLQSNSNRVISTTTHEFAHYISVSDSIKQSKFWNEIRGLESAYQTEIKNLRNAVNSSSNTKAQQAGARFADIYLGSYANKNTDEFFAEAFRNYKLGADASPYSIQVGNLVSKYFKK